MKGTELKHWNKIIGWKLIFNYSFLILNCSIIYSQTWSAVPGVFKPITYTWGVQAMTVYKNKLIVTSPYDSVANVRSPNIISWDNTNWDSLGLGLINYVRVAITYNSELYIAGNGIHRWPFDTTINVLRWNGTQWNATGIIASDNCDDIYAMAVYKGELYVGGNFTKIGGKTVNNIAKWNGSVWSDVAGGITNIWHEVNAMAVFNGELYVGGSFGKAGNVLVNNIAKWDGANWDSLSTGGLDGAVGLLLTDTAKNILYVTGGFSNASGKPNNGVVQWNGVNWNNVGTGTAPGGVCMAIYHGDLYVSTSYTTNNAGENLRNIARWDGIKWRAMGSGINMGASTMSVYNDDLYIGGGFTEVNNDTNIKYLARWHTPVGVEEFEVQSSRFKAYPNPAKNEITIELTEPLQQTTKLNLCLYDNLGKEVLCEVITNTKQQTINTSCLSKGFYLARLFDEERNSLAVQKIVIH